MANISRVKGIGIGLLENFNRLVADEDTLYFISDKGLIYRGKKVVFPTNFTTYRADERDGVTIHVETYGPDGDPLHPEILEFTVATTAMLGQVYNTMIAALDGHAALIASDQVRGHTYLSDATDDTESDVNSGTAATPKAVASALVAAMNYTDSQLAGLGAMRFKGTIGPTNGMLPDLPSVFSVGDTYGVADAGTYAGYTCSVGDLLVCLIASTETGHTPQEYWAWLPNDSTGAVTADNQLSNNQLVIGDGTGRKVKTLAAGTNGHFLKMVSGKPQYAAHNNTDHGIGFGTCSTAAGTAAKTVSMSNYVLKSGGIVSILFTYGVPANATLNINTTGAKAIWYRNAAIVADIIGAGDTATFMYDGTHYVLISLDKNTQSNLSDLTNDISGLATCSTPSATNAKVAVLADFALVTGAIVAVRFTYDVRTNNTLNINETGAYIIKHRNTNIVTGIIRGGDTVTFIFNGTNYHVLSIDRPFAPEVDGSNHDLVDNMAVYNAIYEAALKWEEF